MINNMRKDIHFNAFNAKSDYIPLAVKIASKQLNDNTNWEGMRDPSRVIKSFLEMNKYNLQMESDCVHVIESNFLECLIPSMYDAKVYESAGGLVDIKAFINDISETEGLECLDLYGGEMENAQEHLHYLMKNRIDGVEVLMTRFMSPLDYAVMMRGGDFYMDMLLEPELSKSFLHKLMETTIKVIHIFKKELNESINSCITLRGLYFPGIRLTGDSVVNLSPDMIREFMFPIYERFAEEFGSVMLHYCTLPSPSVHVLPVLAECPAIKCVDNWQGYRTFFDDKGTGMYQDKIAICTDISAEAAENVDKLMEQDTFFSRVARRNGRGIVATTSVENLDAGRKVYDKWRNYFVRKGMF